jgi:hypothetical protein
MHLQWKVHYEVIPFPTLLHASEALMENKNINKIQQTETEL